MVWRAPSSGDGPPCDGSSAANVDRPRSGGHAGAHAADSACTRCRGGPRLVLGAPRATQRCCLGRHARRRRPRHRRSRRREQPWSTDGCPTSPRPATEPQQRLRDRPNGVAPLDDGSTDPFGGGDVAGDHACSPAVSFAFAIALLPALSAADRRAVAVVVAAAVGVRLSASPVSAGRRLPRMRPWQQRQVPCPAA